MDTENIVENLVEVELADDEAFLKIRETLTRIGVASRKNKTLYQSAHILHKRGKYYIVHFKELFKLDGRAGDLSDEDLARRNTIARLLEEWGLIKIVDPSKTDSPITTMSQIKVLPHSEKDEWELEAKYQIGNKR